MISQPGRTYPLRPINEPGTFVLGDRAGQKVYADGSRPPASNPAAMNPNMNAMAMPMNQQAMLAQQNREMTAYDRRQQPRDRIPGSSQRVEDDDSGGSSSYNIDFLASHPPLRRTRSGLHPSPSTGALQA